MKKIDCILWGTGNDAEQFFYRNRDKINLVYCLDNYPKERFYEYEVKKPTQDLCNRKILIAVATSIYYEEVAEQLKSYGLNEIEDFIYFEWFGKKMSGKKMAIIHGNCHTGIVKEYLELSNEFSEQYYIYPVSFIHANQEGEIPNHVLSRCSLLIHQFIRPDNSYGYKLSSEYLCKAVSNECKTVAIPNVYGIMKAFFPQDYEDKKNVRKNLGKLDDPFIYRDSYIDSMIEKGQPTSQIIKGYYDNIFNQEHVVDLFSQNMRALKEREKEWDIKICNFIKDKYKTEQLFYDVGHPTNILLKYIANQILIKLGMQMLNHNCEMNRCLDMHEVPIYPCVKDILGLSWNNDEILRKSQEAQNYVFSDVPMDYAEYVKEYVYWHYETNENKLF